MKVIIHICTAVVKCIRHCRFCLLLLNFIQNHIVSLFYPYNLNLYNLCNLGLFQKESVCNQEMFHLVRLQEESELPSKDIKQEVKLRPLYNLMPAIQYFLPRHIFLSNVYFSLMKIKELIKPLL